MDGRIDLEKRGEGSCGAWGEASISVRAFGGDAAMASLSALVSGNLGAILSPVLLGVLGYCVLLPPMLDCVFSFSAVVWGVLLEA